MEATEEVGTPTNEIEEARTRRSFFDRASDMGLVVEDYGIYTYEDDLSSVVYRQLEAAHDLEIPFLAVFTKPIVEGGDQNHVFMGIVSDNYSFVGHRLVIDQLKDSISPSDDPNNPIYEEYVDTYNFGCQMLDEIVIRHQTNIPSIGDVYPQLMITNGYNGTRAVNVTFGISIHQEGKRVGFGFKRFGSMRQVHVQNSSTTMQTAIGNYVERFNQGVEGLISQNTREQVDEDELLRVLDLVEKLGVRRRNQVSTLLEEICDWQEGDRVRAISRWNLFMAIASFSSIEKNLNTRLLMESVAERCLEFPLQMENVLTHISGRSTT